MNIETLAKNRKTDGLAPAKKKGYDDVELSSLDDADEKKPGDTKKKGDSKRTDAKEAAQSAKKQENSKGNTVSEKDKPKITTASNVSKPTEIGNVAPAEDKLVTLPKPETTITPKTNVSQPKPQTTTAKKNACCAIQ